jgi:hypothetical protein
MDYESDQYECDIWAGHIVITDKETGRCGIVQLRDAVTGRDVTRRQLLSSIRTHGVERALHTFARLVREWN